MNKIILFLLTVLDLLIFPFFFLTYGLSWNRYFGFRDKYMVKMTCQDLDNYLAQLEVEANLKMKQAYKEADGKDVS